MATSARKRGSWPDVTAYRDVFRILAIGVSVALVMVPLAQCEARSIAEREVTERVCLQAGGEPIRVGRTTCRMPEATP